MFALLLLASVGLLVVKLEGGSVQAGGGVPRGHDQESLAAAMADLETERAQLLHLRLQRLAPPAAMQQPPPPQPGAVATAAAGATAPSPAAEQPAQLGGGGQASPTAPAPGPGQPQLTALRAATTACSSHGGLGAAGTCLCLKGYTGKTCQSHQISATGAMAENEKKFDGYAKTVCSKKLSASGGISDETVRLGARIAAERFQVPADANAILYDACAGCGGWMRAFREVRPAIQLVGCDISVDIVKLASEKLPDGVFVSGGGTDPPSLFLPDDIFDIVVAGFCLNNIIQDTYLRATSAASRVEEICVGVRDLYRVAKPGGGVFVPQYYEKDAVTAHKKWQQWPLHLVGKCFPELDLTKEGERPACNVRVRGGVVYAWEEQLYSEIKHKDTYYNGKMKTVLIHKPLDPSVAAVAAVAGQPCTAPG